KDGQVTFKYRDYRDGNKNKTMTLPAFEFIRRYLLHILPPRFVKIRHYGILSTRNKRRLQRCKKMFRHSRRTTANPAKKETWGELLLRITGKDPTTCPACKKGKMVEKRIIRPYSTAPPGSSCVA